MITPMVIGRCLISSRRSLGYSRVIRDYEDEECRRRAWLCGAPLCYGFVVPAACCGASAFVEEPAGLSVLSSARGWSSPRQPCWEHTCVGS